MGRPRRNPLTKTQLADAAKTVKDPTFDVYVSKDDETIRRMSGTLEIAVPEDERARANGITGGSLRFTLELSNVNGDQKVEAPANARPLSELSRQLGGAAALGSLGGAPGWRHGHHDDPPGARARRRRRRRRERPGRHPALHRLHQPDQPGRQRRARALPVRAPVTPPLGAPAVDLMAIAPYAGLIAALIFFLWLDLHFFARGREPNFKEAIWWSIGWLVLSLLAAVVVLVLEGAEHAVLYTTVYLIERSLSLDNLFVFILLFTYFGVPEVRRARLLFWGIVAALAMRGLFILGGITLIEQFHFVIYLLGIALLVLAYRIFRGVGENVDPDKNLMVRLVRKVFPVTSDFREGHWFVKEEGTRYATPLFLCLVAIVFADLAFAIDSIPAAFAITQDGFLIWMGNVFALLGCARCSCSSRG